MSTIPNQHQRQQDNLEVECLLILSATSLAVLGAMAFFILTALSSLSAIP